ncbi:tetratricopeptide repeat protein [Lacrimispora aerotolerans]|uniref:tetratricopeptide repeat protein n=1 Tax=Lacrimispora aerotolerans TaxID=36832 RepID=UPI00047A75AC|nr:tetratricopeptide repeat protein [Lacrimispora aerotolerans]
MDKYEFNIKVEQIKKLVGKNDYETAMKIADTIDWRRVRNTNLLSMVAMVYEKNKEYQEAKDILLQAYERAPIGKRLLYKLAELAIKEGNIEEAEAYYKEFGDLASEDPRQQLLRYMILKSKGAPAQQLIHSLESYTSVELDEKWLYELAELYSLAGMPDRCVETCDRIMLMFGLGKYVDKAMDLKIKYAPLTHYQMDLVENRDKYEARLRAVEQRYGNGMPTEEAEPEEEYYDEEPAQIEEPEFLYQETPMVSNLEASIEEAAVQESLARELSKISYDEPVLQPETKLEHTRVLEDIRRVGRPMTSVKRPKGMETHSEPVIEEDFTDSTLNVSEIYPYSMEEPTISRYDAEEDSQMSQYNPEESENAQYLSEEPGIYQYGEEDPGNSQYAAEEYNNLQYEMEEPDMSQYAMEETDYNQEDDNYQENIDVYENGEFEGEQSAVTAEEEEYFPQTEPAYDSYSSEIENLQQSFYEPVQEELRSASADHLQFEDLYEEEEDNESDDTPVRNHLMIEARTPEKGLSMAVEALKQIHKENGVNNPVAKITGSKLSKRGVLACAEKLAGKDLVIEEAGDLTPEALNELNHIMSQDTSGMIVVLIDNPKQMETLHREHPALASKFECIGSGEMAPPSPSKRPASQPEILREPHTDYQAAPYPETEMPYEEKNPFGNTSNKETHYQETDYQESDYQDQASYQPQGDYEEEYQEDYSYEEESNYLPDEAYEPQEPVEEEPAPRKKLFSRNKKDSHNESYSQEVTQTVREEAASYVSNEEMDIDEFAQYACRYANEIDCSITGKSMLALYERIEIMEEDGISLSKTSAESLIEEAADRAEKPTFGKRIKNLFSSKYDKDGLLVLKEEHFIY